MSPSHETILPLIEACRILETCNTKETAEFCGQIFDILLKHEIITKNKDLLKLLCSIHAMLSSAMIDDILQLLSKKKIQINDTISMHSEVDANTMSLNNIVEMPKELLIHTFQYLHINDIHQVDKTCRLLCTISRNPQSLTHHLSLEFVDQSDYLSFAHYDHIRYSKITSLHFQSDEQEADYIDNVLKILPAFQHLKTLSWNNISPNGVLDVYDYIKSISTFSTLEIVQINFANAANVFDVISKCHNLKTLMLADICDEGDKVTNKINQWMSDNKNNPFPHLQRVTIERFSTNSPAVQLFMYWILAQGHSKKHLTILDDHDLPGCIDDIDETYLPQFFDPYTNDERILSLQKMALKNVSELILGLYDYHLVNNISNWCNICEEISFNRFTMDIINVYLNGAFSKTTSELIQPLHNIVSISQHSTFRWSSNYLYIKEFIDDYVKWIVPIPIDRTHKRILNEWPLHMISNVSTKSELFDNITLSIFLNDRYGGITELCELVDAWLKIKKLLK
eukprot:482370_1